MASVTLEKVSKFYGNVEAVKKINLEIKDIFISQITKTNNLKFQIIHSLIPILGSLTRKVMRNSKT